MIARLLSKLRRVGAPSPEGPGVRIAPGPDGAALPTTSVHASPPLFFGEFSPGEIEQIGREMGTP